MRASWFRAFPLPAHKSTLTVLDPAARDKPLDAGSGSLPQSSPRRVIWPARAMGRSLTLWASQRR